MVISNLVSGLLTPKIGIGGGTSQTTPATGQSSRDAFLGTPAPVASSGPTYALGASTVSGLAPVPKATSAPITGLVKPPASTSVTAPLAPVGVAPQAGQSGTAGSSGNQYSLQNGQWVLGGQNQPSGGGVDPVTYIPPNSGQSQPTAPVQPTTLAPQADAPITSSNPPTSTAGLIGANIGQATNYYDKQAGLTKQAQDIAANTAKAEADLTGGYNGIGAADTNSRLGQLEQFKNSGIAAIQAQQAAQAGYEAPITSAYSAGINASQPQVAGFGQTSFNPLTNSFGGGSTGNTQGTGGFNPTYNPTQDAQNFGTAVMNGKMTYDQAVSSMAYTNVGKNTLDQAILAMGGNPQTLQAQGTAAQSNITTGGTAATSAAASGLQSATQNYVAANTAYSTATNQAGNLQSTMAATGINTNPQFINSKINTLQNQLGSSNYTAFITALSEAQQAYTSLLSSVGAATPTVNGQQATAIFNANSTPAQINAAITALNQAAYAKLKPMYDQISTYQGQLGGGSNGTQNGTFNW